MNARAIKLVLYLYSHEIEISLYGTDHIRYRPPSEVDDDLRQRLKENKPQLIQFLHHLNAPPNAPFEPLRIWGRCASAVLSTVKYLNLRVIYRKEFEEQAASYEYDDNIARDEAERLGFEYLLFSIRENVSEEPYTDADQGISNYCSINLKKKDSL